MHSSRMHELQGCVWGVSVLWVYVWGSVLLLPGGVLFPRPSPLRARDRPPSNQEADLPPDPEVDPPTSHSPQTKRQTLSLHGISRILDSMLVKTLPSKLLMVIKVLGLTDW